LYWFGLFQVPSLTGGRNEDLKDFAEGAHEFLFWTLVAVAAAHAAAALVHHFRDRDEVLRRMLPGSRRSTPSP
jgi:cytochrome b561